MARRRYRYDPESKQVVEVGADWTDTERRAPVPTEELTYGNAVATDGTPINTRRRHREYMQQNGLAMASDYTESWKQAEKRRADFFAGKTGHEGLREAIGRAVDKVRGRKR
jgi:hypothetical protein